MTYPDITQYLEDSKLYNMIPVYREIRADFDTPVSIFLKVKAKILLESVEQGENVGRYSIIGLGQRLVIKINGRRLNITHYNGDTPKESENYRLPDPLDKARECLKRFTAPDYEGLPPFYGGAVGYLGFEGVVPAADSGQAENGTVPDGIMVVPETVLVYDTVKRSVFIIVLTTPGPNPEETYNAAINRIDEIREQLSTPLPVNGSYFQDSPQQPDITPRTGKEKFLESVEKCKQYISDGDIIQVVVSQKFDIQTDVDAFELYRTLRVINPSPYLFFLDFDDFAMIGSSPEVMVRVQDGEMLLKPIAGTRERGKTVAEDAQLAEELLEDPKERAEHIMLVDLGRNDLGRVAVPGSVGVTDYMKIEKYSHVMHIVSTIEARLDAQYDEFDVIRACFPAGTLSGAPKIRAIEIITEMEEYKRGPYGGMVFNIAFNGNMDSCITIRTIVLKDNIATVQAGAGIVADSVPEREYEETLNKARALIRTIEMTRKEGAA